MSTAPVEGESAAQLIDALLGGGQPVDEVCFGDDLDADHADRSSYLIPIAEAAGGLGARKVILSTRDEDLLITFEGVELADPFAQLRAASTEQSNRALGRLSVGLHMALGLPQIERIAVSYSSHSQMLIALYRRDAPVRLLRRAPHRVDELRILIDRSRIDRELSREACQAELEHLRHAVRHSPHIFELDGRSISAQPRDWDYVTRSAAAGLRYESGLERSGVELSVIELWSEGVCVEMLAGPGFAFRAALHLEAPRRDLLQMKIVRDEQMNAALAAIKTTTYRETLAKLAQDDATWTKTQRPSHWPKARVDRALGRRQAKFADRARELMLGLALYLAGIAAGTVGISALANSDWLGLFVLFFLFYQGYMGASHMANALGSDERKIKLARAVLLGLAILIALSAGMVVGRQYVIRHGSVPGVERPKGCERQRSGRSQPSALAVTLRPSCALALVSIQLP